MKIFCENCQKFVGRVPDEKLPEGKRISIKCPQCSTKITFSKEEAPGPKITPPPIQEIKHEEFQQHADSSAVNAAAAARKAKERVDEYDFTVMEVIKEAWEKTKGIKGPVWGGSLLIIGLLLVINIIVGILMKMLGHGSTSSMAISYAVQVTVSFALYPFIAGVMMMGVRRAVDLPVSYKMVFGYLQYMVPIIVSSILVTILTFIGFAAFVIPGLYLSIAFLLTIPLIIDKDMGPWEAMMKSLKGITPKWFKVFAIYLIMIILYVLSMIPLFIGIIWTLPMLIVIGGILYRNIFGVDAVATAIARGSKDKPLE